MISKPLFPVRHRLAIAARAVNAWRSALGLAALLACAPGAAQAEAPVLTTDQTCQTAVYHLADGRWLDIGPGVGADLRWRLDDGRSGRLSAGDHWSSTLGWTGRPDGVRITLPVCGGDQVSIAEGSGKPMVGRRVPLVSQDVSFRSGDVVLQGRLVLPVGHGKVAILVDVHGSEQTAATTYYFDQRLYAAQGVGVFVWDKRGTGRSTGAYTQDFRLLAQDAVAALAEARRLAGPRLGRIGLQGGSQGGWVAPLAATMASVDFVIVDFGLAGSPAEENTDQTVLELARKGYVGEDLKGAAEVAEAVNRVAATHFRGGFEQLDAVRAKYGDRAWFKQLGGQFTGLMLQFPDDVIRQVGPSRDVGLPLDWDAVAVLKQVKAPMLWVLADDDTLAPNGETRRRLSNLVDQGFPITALAFPATDHGVYEFVTDEKGARLNTRNPEGYLRTTLDWARRGRLAPPYGPARVILQPKGRK